MSIEAVKADKAASQENWEPKILVFACNWCTYAGADLAGLSRLQYPPNVRILRVPCSGRVNPQFVIRAFQKGIDGVLVAGCHPGDCHYATGNYFTRRRYLVMQRLLEFMGMDPARFQARWISGSEGPKFQQVVTQLTQDIKALGPNRKLRDME
ncbi:MAG: hydrogenase iron-sulfur subunit [Bacillota bacterium]|jgi:coenzyme F420-reducing hydrogenase delta subunit|uniref:Hydrogenase iron-sulfur subunit n=1 Tax=Thermanaerosceptrum fracticalcis TaxID=1712410 RepID=A0A7G6DZS5_THEFR|nr:hydrogenase iron-sulfur subunit [Thermanaerosceptrum fracticalcis]MBZ4652841.1 methyl-viologen-reducing hydrogenase delta subunit [Peptococcaceae bacterium]QNB45329.1 hydrogenase iron-sulfur subunit [Thermanaerosceptrum fracticalcis]